MEKMSYEKLKEVVYHEQLDNGLDVYLLPRTGVAKVYGMFATKYGSNDLTFVPLGETEKRTIPQGVAHFLEHKMFEKEHYDVLDAFNKLGAMPNAYTGFNETVYFAAGIENTDTVMETLLDFVQTPYFTEETVENEKPIIEQEANMYQDDADRRLFTGGLQAMYKNHPVKNEVLGTIESVYATTKEDLEASYHTFYHPSNMKLMIAGNFEPEEMMEVVKNNQAAKDFKPEEKIQRFMPEEPAEVAMKKKTIKMPVSMPKCLVGIKEYSEEQKQEDVLHNILLPEMVLSHFFGRSGKFYKALYDEGLIDNSFTVESIKEIDHGYSIIDGNTNHPEQFAKRIKEMLLSLHTNTLEEVDLERMKKRRIGRMIRSLNSLEGTAQEYMWFERRGLDYFKQIPAVQSITLEDIQSFIERWIDEDRLAVCEILPE